MKIKWQTDPKPATVEGLTYFRIEIVSTEDPATQAVGGAIAWESKNILVGTSRQAARSTSLKVADFQNHVEDGLYFFRVRGYSSTGDILNEEDAGEHPAILRNPRDPEGKRIYESEDVWFWVDEDEPPPVEPTRNVTVESFLEAQTSRQDGGDRPRRRSLRREADASAGANHMGHSQGRPRRGDLQHRLRRPNAFYTLDQQSPSPD